MALIVTTVAFAQETSPEGLPIESLDVAGNVTLTRSEVLAEVRVRAGQLFNTEIAAEDVRRLAGLEGVETAYYNTQIVNDRVVLTYVVVEQNLVRDIIFKERRRFNQGTKL
jgi:outer membrane protein assembly factor BamA